MASKKTLNLDNLQALGARRLAELLLELAAGDAAAKRRLRLELSAEAGPEAVAADIGKRLATLRQARSFVDWQKRPAFVRDLDRQRRLILDKVAEDRPDLALELLWRFMALAGPVQERVDDSRGDVGDVFRQACRDLGAVAARASPDPARLADQVLEAVTSNQYGEYDRLVEVVLPALGRAGVARLKERLTAALAARPRAKGGYDATAGALRRALQDVADHEGDVDAFVRHEEGGRSPQRAAAVATRLLAAGRVGGGARRPRAGCPGRALAPGPGGAVGLLARGGGGRRLGPGLGGGAARRRPGQEEAQRFRWGRFEARLDAEHLRAYLKALPDFEDVAAERKALEHALAFPHFGMALVFLVDWKALREAARLVLERRGEIDGNLYFVLDPAAKALEGRHPLAAVLLRRAMVEDTLGRRQGDALPARGAAPARVPGAGGRDRRPRRGGAARGVRGAAAGAARAQGRVLGAGGGARRRAGPAVRSVPGRSARYAHGQPAWRETLLRRFPSGRLARSYPSMVFVTRMLANFRWSRSGVAPAGTRRKTGDSRRQGSGRTGLRNAGRVPQVRVGACPRTCGGGTWPARRGARTRAAGRAGVAAGPEPGRRPARPDGDRRGPAGPGTGRAAPARRRRARCCGCACRTGGSSASRCSAASGAGTGGRAHRCPGS